ncbi:hypothetical protein ABZ570_04710 [Micromonospora sp. NPDC007271]|uniref:hypothetical protein n=1 Tax=Micromonospora sp. NPDC007271 TaxID=3154587 RepID=UPI0033D4C81C
MTGFEEYAALVRELTARQRGGERAVAAEADRRRALQTAVEQLGQRLATQGQHLDQLGRAVGGPAPAVVPQGAPTVPALATPGAAPAPETGAGATGGAAAAPGRPGVGAYPEGLPAPRVAEVDPAAELAAAQQLADEADRHGQQAEVLGHRPPLLPTWSPAARAAAVYAACALAGSLLMLVALIGSPIPASGLDLLAAASCAGVPLLSFLAGHLVLGRWGRPPISTGPPPSRYLPLGFVICALFSPSLFCLYLLAFRLLR